MLSRSQKLFVIFYFIHSRLLNLEIEHDNYVMDTLEKNKKKQQLENDLKALKTLVSIHSSNCITMVKATFM